VRSSPRPEAIRAVQKVLLVDCLQYHRHRLLKHLVFKRRYPYRADFRPVPFRNVHAPHRRRSVGVSGLRSVEQLLEIALQLSRILLRRLAIHSHRAVLAHAPIGLV